MATKTARINALRGLCREFGITAPLRRQGLPSLYEQPSDDKSAVPHLLRVTLHEMIAEIRNIQERLQAVETELPSLAQQSPVCERLRKIPGVGLITATAFIGAVRDIKTFRSPRSFASWLGPTPREFSSGNVRRLGRIGKRGDGYLRMLLIHGARALLYSGDSAVRAGRPLDAIRDWGIKVRGRSGHNKAAVPVANKWPESFGRPGFGRIWSFEDEC